MRGIAAALTGFTVAFGVAAGPASADDGRYVRPTAVRTQPGQGEVGLQRGAPGGALLWAGVGALALGGAAAVRRRTRRRAVPEIERRARRRIR
ncbi:hypothetical protein ACIBEJ_37630 [Nonomuraea sp. NPDC050790]|uniref:hypothetical protein n=1 Tax=Nonomuraea sp. NPDC050790 TaxID=3364371 RepID=UPI0037A541D2